MPVMTGAEPFYFEGEAEAPAVLLSHGFTGTPHSMRGWGRYLADAGLSVSGPLLPGHGTTWQQMNKTRWEQWYGTLEVELDRLRGGSRQLFVAGLSMGGGLALRLAENHPDIRGLILVNPAVEMSAPGSALLPIVKHLLPSMPGVAGDIKKSGVTEVGYDRTPLRAADSMRTMLRVMRGELDRVRAPIQFYRSPEDHVVAGDSLETLIRLAVNTTVETVLLHNSYHVATLDNEAETIFAGSLEFIRAHSAPAPEA